MIPQASITAWRSVVPWADDAQVEQDLVLSRALVELFSAPSLTGKIALRGGTALNKLFIQPPSRYSEDIDLVQTSAGPIGPALDAMRERLDPWLGRPKRSSSEGSVTLMYRFESEIAPVRPLRLKVEINTREHFSVFGFQAQRFSVENPWFTGRCEVMTYALDELLGTKLRALYQRRKGRDLFDLWHCLTSGKVNVDRVRSCFEAYMEHEKHTVSRAEFERNLHEKSTDAAFLEDIPPLLVPSTTYDVHSALEFVGAQIISRLPGDAWRGTGPGSDKAETSRGRRRNPRRE